VPSSVTRIPFEGQRRDIAAHRQGEGAIRFERTHGIRGSEDAALVAGRRWDLSVCLDAANYPGRNGPSCDGPKSHSN
jgi:hypothetical protein